MLCKLGVIREDIFGKIIDANKDGVRVIVIVIARIPRGELVVVDGVKRRRAFGIVIVIGGAGGIPVARNVLGRAVADVAPAMGKTTSDKIVKGLALSIRIAERFTERGVDIPVEVDRFPDEEPAGLP